MRERAQLFGSHRGLVGILTEPDAGVRRADAPAVLFSNVGVHHRAGPFRIYVELARALAAAGITSLRFDMAGLGDSEARTEPAGELERAMLDLREAMDFLGTKGIERFALVGFCSGVDPVHAVAREDERVTGAVFLDGYAYRTPGFYLRRSKRYTQARVWREAVQRRLRRLRKEPEPSEEVYVREYPSREACEADLLKMRARDARLLFLFTGGAQMSFNAPAQLFEMFPGLKGQAGVEVDLMPEADHLFSTIELRRALVERVRGWAERSLA